MSGELLEAASNMEGDASITELSAQGITDMAVMMLPEKYQVCMVVDLLREQKGNHDICSDRWQPPLRRRMRTNNSGITPLGGRGRGEVV